MGDHESSPATATKSTESGVDVHVDVHVDGPNGPEGSPDIGILMDNLSAVKSSLQEVLREHEDGSHGYVTREWGFATPNGLGGKLGGKFTPWEDKLSRVPNFFWPIEAYGYMEESSSSSASGRPPDLDPRGERLYGNTALHLFLEEPPSPEVELLDSDMDDFRSASRLMILLGTLSHLYGNSADDPGTAPTPLPRWIEEPLVRVAQRLDVEPSLTGHFLVTDNWVWKPQSQELTETPWTPQEILEKLVTMLDIRDRRHNIHVYKRCWIGSQFVDILLECGYVNSREEAVRLGRYLNKKYKWFDHVTRDHLLMDEYLFFRFHASVLASMKQDHQKMDQISNEEENSKEWNEAVRLISTMPVRNRRYRLKMYKDCFVAENLVDVIVNHGCAESRNDAVQLIRRINHRHRLVEHVCQDHDFMDGYLFFRFVNDVNGSDAELESDNSANEDRSQSLSITSSQRSVGREDTVTQARMISPQSGSDDTAKRPSFSKNPSIQSISSISSTIKNISTAIQEPFTRRSSARRIVSFRKGEMSDLAVSEQSGVSMDVLDYSFDQVEMEEREFCFDDIQMLYPAFGNNHERVNQLIPSCMGYQLRSLPYLVLDVLSTIGYLLEAKRDGADLFKDEGDSQVHADLLQLADLLHQIAFSLSRCKEQFQLMSTDPTKRTFNSKHVSIRQTQPLSNGVLVQGEKRKGVTGVQFPYFHVLDWLLGRHHFNEKQGMIAEFSTSVDRYYPKPQREYIQRLSALNKFCTLRGFLDVIGRPPAVLAAYNHLIQCYAGEGGMLMAHCRKLYSYMHNDVQSSTSGTNHAANHDGGGGPVASIASRSKDNHAFADRMFNAMRGAVEERWRLRLAPLMTEVTKVVYSTSESSGITTVAFDLSNKNLRYEYGDVVKVLLPNDDKDTYAWEKVLSSLDNGEDNSPGTLGLHDLPGGEYNGWGWAELWEALGWKNDDGGRPLVDIARYIEQAQILDDTGRPRWINSPFDLSGKGRESVFATPPEIPRHQLASLVPVSPRIYSVSGVEQDRVFLNISKPRDGGRHHGYRRMADPSIGQVHCSFSPATFFLVPPKKANLVCVASGTGVAPFVGLSEAIRSRRGTYTICHQCKSSDLFLSNSQAWLDFTACNPGACVMGYISGDRSRRNCPMRYIIRNGEFCETTVLGRHSSYAYYFECPRFQDRLREVYNATEGALNLAYCCGGIQSAIQPLKDIIAAEGWNYEFTVESYAVVTLSTTKNICQIGGTVVDLDAVAPVHEGGDQILHQIQSVSNHDQQSNDDAQSPAKKAPPDHSDKFWQLHPHAYNLHRCLRAPFDADFEAFSAFLNRQTMTKSVVTSNAEKYTQIALDSPHNSKIVRVASELQASAIKTQLAAGDLEGVKKAARYLGALLNHVPSNDDNLERWSNILQEASDALQSMSLNGATTNISDLHAHDS